jgi:hypothetical protein
METAPMQRVSIAKVALFQLSDELLCQVNFVVLGASVQ